MWYHSNFVYSLFDTHCWRKIQDWYISYKNRWSWWCKTLYNCCLSAVINREYVKKSNSVLFMCHSAFKLFLEMGLYLSQKKPVFLSVCLLTMSSFQLYLFLAFSHWSRANLCKSATEHIAAFKLPPVKVIPVAVFLLPIAKHNSHGHLNSLKKRTHWHHT